MHADNPLLQPWDTPHGLPPFGRIEAAHFAPAFAEAMLAHRAELDALAAQAGPPSFDNTVAAFDRAGRALARVSSVFHNLVASNTSPALQAVQRDMAAPLAAHFSAVYMHAGVFARVDALHRRRDSLGLDHEQMRLLDRVHLDYVRSGARLAPAAQQRYAQVMQRLAELQTAFAQNVLHDEASFHMPLPTEVDRAGLPEFALAAARQAAADRGLDPAVPVVTLARSLVLPFLSFSTRRDLREKLWRAWVGRGEHEGAHDNRPLLREILLLRHEQAAAHGNVCYADYALADTMAGTRAGVQGLLDEVWPRALAAVQREAQALQDFQRSEGEGNANGAALEAWDWRFWAERLRQQRYAVDDAEIKPYFALERMVQAAFDCAHKLFGLEFRHRADLPVYHPDVKAYEVFDAQGRLKAIFLQDNFARPAKRSGAWMSHLRWQSRNADGSGAAALPVILNNNNFAKGAPGEPLLLSLEDARTLFHEFGHGLHGMLSDVRYEGLSGTQVLMDFVELPSQLFEHWLLQPQVLAQHARHVRTGEPMPAELQQRLQRARRFNQGYETVRYCASTMVDMAVHSLGAAELPADLCAFEADYLRRAGLPASVGMNHRLVHFQHLFSSSAYAAGYYVYLWAEVLDADGFGAFSEAGDPFAPAVAQALQRYIYASGNSLEPASAYRAFRGRDPTVMPLLEKRGLVPAEGD